jgi:predicted transcriptional regulator
MVKIAISERPLAGLFGSESAYQVLMFIQNYEKGYASEIARTFGISLNQAQNQLKKLEELGILISRKEANARMFYFNKTPVTDSLRKFLNDMLQLLPDATLQKYYRQRRRPRRYGKK